MSFVQLNRCCQKESSDEFLCAGEILCYQKLLEDFLSENNIQERLHKIFLKVFNCSDPRKTASPDNLAGWDSLGHLLLVSAIEEEFKIKLTVEDIFQMVNFRAIQTILEEQVSHEPPPKDSSGRTSERGEINSL